MPTPVQRKALPVILSGVDTCVMARTGSGKTIAFLIPLLEKLYAMIIQQQQQSSSSLMNHSNGTVRGVILSPTRELSQQTLIVLNKLTSVVVEDTSTSSGSNYNNNLRKIKSIGITGGESMEQQFSMLANHPDIIVATPGRLAHHLSEISDFTLSSCVMCILDEADRLIEMGFSMQIKQITKTMSNENCQKVMLSATMPKMLIEFTKSGFCTDPAVVRLDNEVNVSDELRIAFITTRSLEKDAALLHIMQQIMDDKDQSTNTTSSENNDINENDQNTHSKSSSIRTGLTLIFAATRHHVEYIHTLLTAAGMNTTMIYGTLDHEARQHNLSLFRSGKKPILVVTDVAARGIDVPLIDHVIHYHFPFTPKLFIHRSGRAARAGRIGFCWCLVEPDEMPYMIDLHLFLGRRPINMNQIDDDDHKIYNLTEMTPDMVHYGSVPESIATSEVENVTRIMNSELYGSLEAESLRSLTKVCKNAMIQYRRTRSEASKEGVRRAKAILEGERTETGQRIGNGSIPPHPLLRQTELLIHARKQNINSKVGHINDLDNLRQRDEFLRALSNFRPKESVFEAFATGKSKDTSVMSHIDKGRTTVKNKKNDSSVALIAMKNMRRQMQMVRDKGTCLVVAGSAEAQVLNNEMLIEQASPKFQTNQVQPINHDRKCDNSDSSQMDTIEQQVEKHNDDETTLAIETFSAVVVDNKRRMSKAERKRLKLNPESIRQVEFNSNEVNLKKNKKLKTDFRDTEYFIDHDFTSNQEETERLRYIETAMQPSSSSSAPRGSIRTALRLEEAMMDIVGDENDDIVKKQRMLRWDKSKRKYVQTTVGDELSGESKSKKLRTESGQLMKSNKLKLGELYQKWQKKTNRSIGRNGVFDDVDQSGIASDDVSFSRKNKAGKGGKKSPSTGSTKKSSTNEMKTALDIKKDRDLKQKMKIKNMKKDYKK
jgi:ATP-dependent RNA helicase DDX54/DBP10